jgi:putative tricarboxylic transport membrane protein
MTIYGFTFRVLLLTLFASAFVPVHAQKTAWRPERAIELVAPAGPGGLNDLMLRNMQNVMQSLKLVDVPLAVSNKGGAGGALALNYLSQHSGDPHYLTLSTINMLANHIMGQGALNYTDFTPLGHLMHSYMGFAVQPDSRIANAKDLMARLRKDPGAVSISVGTSLGNPGHIASALVAKSVGVDPRNLKTVVFKSAGEALAALFGGHIDLVVSPLPNLAKHAQAKTLRVIAVAAPERAGGIFSEAPTLREQGTNVVVSTWRGAMGARGLQPAQVAYWESVVGRIVDSEEWAKELAREYGSRTRMSAAENSDFLAAEYRSYQTVLGELGMAKAR